MGSVTPMMTSGVLFSQDNSKETEGEETACIDLIECVIYSIATGFQIHWLGGLTRQHCTHYVIEGESKTTTECMTKQCGRMKTDYYLCLLYWQVWRDKASPAVHSDSLSKKSQAGNFIHIHTNWPSDKLICTVLLWKADADYLKYILWYGGPYHRS